MAIFIEAPLPSVQIHPAAHVLTPVIIPMMDGGGALTLQLLFLELSSSYSSHPQMFPASIQKDIVFLLQTKHVRIFKPEQSRHTRAHTQYVKEDKVTRFMR